MHNHSYPASLLALVVVSIIVSTGFVNAHAQQQRPARLEIRSKAELIERYTRFAGNEASMIIDLLRKRVSESPNSNGYIILYCGQKCRQGEIEAHINCIVVALKLKNEVSGNLRILFGGFRKATETDFWFVPEGAAISEFISTESVRDVEFKGKYPRTYVPYHCCE